MHADRGNNLVSQVRRASDGVLDTSLEGKLSDYLSDEEPDEADDDDMGHF